MHRWAGGVPAPPPPAHPPAPAGASPCPPAPGSLPGTQPAHRAAPRPRPCSRTRARRRSTAARHAASSLAGRAARPRAPVLGRRGCGQLLHHRQHGLQLGDGSHGQPLGLALAPQRRRARHGAAGQHALQSHGVERPHGRSCTTVRRQEPAQLLGGHVRCWCGREARGSPLLRVLGLLGRAGPPALGDRCVLMRVCTCVAVCARACVCVVRTCAVRCNTNRVRVAVHTARRAVCVCMCAVNAAYSLMAKRACVCAARPPPDACGLPGSSEPMQLIYDYPCIAKTNKLSRDAAVRSPHVHHTTTRTYTMDESFSLKFRQKRKHSMANETKQARDKLGAQSASYHT